MFMCFSGLCSWLISRSIAPSLCAEATACTQCKAWSDVFLLIVFMFYLQTSAGPTLLLLRAFSLDGCALALATKGHILYSEKGLKC